MKKYLFLIPLLWAVNCWSVGISSGTFTIGPGQNFTNLAAFQSSLTGGTPMIGDATAQINALDWESGTIDFAALNSAGYTIHITLANSLKHSGYWDGTKSSWTVSSGNLIRCRANKKFDFNGLQISNTGTGYLFNIDAG